MTTQRSGLGKFFTFVVLCVVSGTLAFVLFADNFLQAANMRNPHFVLLTLGMVLSAGAVPAGYWIYAKHKGMLNERDRAQVGLACHAAGYAMINAMLLVYIVADSPYAPNP